MTQPFQLTLPGFEGPVDALPPLVSARRLEVDELPLAEIAAQFLAETQRREEVDLDQAGEVLSAVARLMLMKSIHLLAQPAEDEPEEAPVREPADDIELIREAARSLGLLQGMEMYPASDRPPLVPRRTQPRSPRLLLEAWNQLRVREAKRLVRASVPTFVRLEVAVSKLIGRLRAGRAVVLSHVIEGGGRRDVVVHFLAALELVRTRRARVTQPSLFGDITLEWIGVDDRAEQRAG